MNVEHSNKVIQRLGNAFLEFAFWSLVVGAGVAMAYVSHWKQQEEVAMKVRKIGEALHTEHVELVSEDGNTFFVKTNGKIYHAQVRGQEVTGIFVVGEDQMQVLLSEK